MFLSLCRSFGVTGRSGHDASTERGSQDPAEMINADVGVE